MTDQLAPNAETERPERLEATVPIQNTELEPGQSDKTSLEAIVEAVLGSASVANKSADLASASTERLLDAVGDLNTISKRAKATNIALLSICCLLLIASAGAFFTLSIQLNSRLGQANSILNRISNKSSEISVSLESLKRFDAFLEHAETEKSSDRVERIDAKIDSIISEIKKTPPPVTSIAEKSQRALELSNQALSSQIRGLENRIHAQTLQISALSATIQSMRSELTRLPALEKALVLMSTPAPTPQSIKKPANNPNIEVERARPERNTDYIRYRAQDADKSKENK